jgi:glutamate-1-semialdehyde 2,1-aminomutase/spore coat polysaccharide biosynthesis protein SpsF
MGGAQEYYGVVPDLACLGKGMANGMPLSAVVGRADVMGLFDEIFFSGTFNGETLSLAACKATIEDLKITDGLNKIWKYGNDLLAGLQELINDNGLNEVAKPMGQGVRSILSFPHDDDQEMLYRRTFFMQECVKRGLLYFCLHVPCVAHGQKELDFTLGVLSEVMPLFAAAHQANDFASLLDGPSVEAIFRKP